MAVGRETRFHFLIIDWLNYLSTSPSKSNGQPKIFYARSCKKSFADSILKQSKEAQLIRKRSWMKRARDWIMDIFNLKVLK